MERKTYDSAERIVSDKESDGDAGLCHDDAKQDQRGETDHEGALPASSAADEAREEGHDASENDDADGKRDGADLNVAGEIRQLNHHEDAVSEHRQTDQDEQKGEDLDDPRQHLDPARSLPSSVRIPRSTHDQERKKETAPSL